MHEIDDWGPCDWCGEAHNLVQDHCDKGQHCTSFTASCAAEWSGDDHPAACHVCGADLTNIATGSESPT